MCLMCTTPPFDQNLILAPYYKYIQTLLQLDDSSKHSTVKPNQKHPRQIKRTEVWTCLIAAQPCPLTHPTFSLRRSSERFRRLNHVSAPEFVVHVGKRCRHRRVVGTGRNGARKGERSGKSSEWSLLDKSVSSVFHKIPFPGDFGPLLRLNNGPEIRPSLSESLFPLVQVPCCVHV